MPKGGGKREKLDNLEYTNSVIVAGISTGIAVLIANLLVLWLISRRISRVAHIYFDPQGEKPSEFFKFLDSLGAVIGAHTAQSLKSVFMSAQSADSKATKAVEGAMATDMIASQGGLLGAAVQSFPALQQLISKNPGWLPIAQKLMAKSGAGLSGVPGNGDTKVEGFDPF